MIYKITLEDGDIMTQEGAVFILQNETHALYQHDTVPASVTVISSYNDSDISSLYAAQEWQQPTSPDSA